MLDSAHPAAPVNQSIQVATIGALEVAPPAVPAPVAPAKAGIVRLRGHEACAFALRSAFSAVRRSASRRRHFSAARRPARSRSSCSRAALAFMLSIEASSVRSVAVYAPSKSALRTALRASRRISRRTAKRFPDRCPDQSADRDRANRFRSPMGVPARQLAFGRTQAVGKSWVAGLSRNRLAQCRTV